MCTSRSISIARSRAWARLTRRCVPRVSPARRSNDTPSTAWTTPSRVKKWVLRSWTRRTGAAAGAAAPLSGLLPGSVTERTAILSWFRTADQDAALVIDPDRLAAADRHGEAGDPVTAVSQIISHRLRDRLLET